MPGIGIGIYFSPKAEPIFGFLCGLLAAAPALSLGSKRLSPAFQVCIARLILCTLDFTLAAWRAHDIAAPTPSFHNYSPNEGRHVNVDRPQADAVRLTIDHVILCNLRPSKTPSQVRVSLHGTQGYYSRACSIVT